jgi:hypothetical protein
MRSLVTLALCLLIGTLQAQYYYNSPATTPGGNPGNLNGDIEKPYGDGLPSGWTNIQPTTNPAWTATQNIPFTFNFNGAPVTQYKVSTTGVLTFTTTASTVPTLPNLSLPNASIPDKSVLIWGLNWGGSNSNDAICTKTFGTTPNRQHWIFFSSYNSNATGFNCYTYWSIVLEETTNKIYIVDQCNNEKQQCEPHLTLGIQINSSTATSVSGTPNVPALAGNSQYPGDNKYYEFIYGVQPAYDLSVTWLQTNPFIGQGAQQELKGTIKNFGLTAITSFQIHYSINGGPVKSCTETGVNIPMYGDTWYFHDSMWTPTVLGNYTIKVWATNLNGSHADENHSNDTLTKVISVMGVFVPKILLHEVFTSSTCDLCKDGNISINNVLSAHPGEYTWISYQMNYPNGGDPYYTSDGNTRRLYYGIDTIPEMMVSGIERIYPPAYTQSRYSDFTQPAYLFMSPTHTIIGNTVTVNAAFTPFESNNSTTLKAHIAIVEKTTTGNVRTNGETSFKYVLKKMVPDGNGTAVGPFVVGFNPSINKNYTFTAGHTVEQLSDLAVVVFVQDMSNGKILQSAWSTLASSISQVDGEGNGIIAIYPNPVEDMANIKFELHQPMNVSLQVFDLNGRLVSSRDLGQRNATTHVESFDVSQFSPGMYLIKLNIGDKSFHSRLVVN